MRKSLVFLLLIGLIFNLANTVLAAENQQLYLKKGSPYILIFDERIENYTVNNKKSVKIEILTDIFNTKREMLIKLLEETATSMVVQTKTKTYNFDILNSKTMDNIKPTGLNILVDEPPHFTMKYFHHSELSTKAQSDENPNQVQEDDSVHLDSDLEIDSPPILIEGEN